VHQPTNAIASLHPIDFPEGANLLLCDRLGEEVCLGAKIQETREGSSLHLEGRRLFLVKKFAGILEWLSTASAFINSRWIVLGANKSRGQDPRLLSLFFNSHL
jgi:hypothetical protein